MLRQRRLMYLMGLICILFIWGIALATLMRHPDTSQPPALPTLVSLDTAPVEGEAVVTVSPSATPLVADSGKVAISGKTSTDTAQQTTSLAAVVIPPDPIPNVVIARLSHDISDEMLAQYVDSFGGEVLERIRPLKTVVLRLPNEVAALPQADFIAQTEADYYVGAFAAPPTDPYFPSQWNLLTVRAPQGWDLLAPNVLPVTVALIDSGICASHPELENRVTDGWDFVEADATPNDAFGHGCGVAGVLASNVDNSFGIAGIAPHIRVMPLRVLNEQGLGSYSNVAAAVVYAVDHGAQIVNLSLGGSQPSNLLREAVQYARNAGVLVIAASGNTGRELAMYPAAYEEVIGVGSVDPDLQRSDFSNWGVSVKLYAPGRNIMTISSDGGFRTMSGTSLAAPHVAGVAAIELSLGRQLVVDGGIVAVQMDEAPSAGPGGTVSACDLADVQTARLQFFDVFRAYLADSATTPRQTVHAARNAYLSAAAPCYAEIYSQPLRFDGGGFTLTNGGPTAQFQLFGTKWGENSPFNPAQPPASSGGTVAYSFMPNGVNLASKEGINPLFSLALSVDELINLPPDYAGPEDIPNVGCLDTSNPALVGLSASEVEALLDEAVRDEIRAAFAIWSAEANISFQEVGDVGEDFNVANPDPVSDIRIAAQVIDGPGAELGHAYYPGPVPGEENATGTGDLFLDADENWGCGSVVNDFGETIDIGIVAVHEIGHAIGMSHQNPAVTALMNPSYNATLFALQSDDIAGVRAIYGSDELGPPTPNTPIIVGDQVTLSWTPTGGSPDTFQVQVTTSGDTAFSAPLFNVTTDATTYITPPLVNGAYLWRVRAFANGAWSDYSAVGFANPNTTFVISVSVPVLISPFNTAKLTNGQVEFEWGSVSGIGNTYQLQISSGPEFAQPLAGDFTVGSNLSFTLPTALADGSYFWRVRANNGDFSAPFTFSIDSNVPTLNNPTDGTVINTTSVTLTWDPVPGATEYEVHLDTSPNFVGLLFIDKLFIDKLFIDKLFIDKLFIDKLFIDKLFIDKLFIDKLFIDKLFIDKLFIDKLFSDELFIDKLFIDKLFIDKLFIDKLFIDKLFSDELFIDKLFIDKLFIDKLFIDKLFIDKLTTNSYTATNLSEGDHYWRVRARRVDGSWSGWSEPSSFIIDTPKENVVINEIFPGEPSWIEIYNADTSAVDMTGWQFIAYRPDGTISTTYTFPNGFTLAAGAYVVLHEEDLGGGNINTTTDLYIGANTIDWPLESPVGALSIEDETQTAPDGESRATHRVRMNRLRLDMTRIHRRGAGGYDRAYNDIFVTTTDPSESEDGECSIIEAINNANNDDSGLGDCEAGDGEDTIYLQGVETYLFVVPENNYAGANALPPIFTPIIIVGNGSTLKRHIEAEAEEMRFFVIDGVEGDGELTLNDMFLEDGYLESNNGGAIYNMGGILRAESRVRFIGNENGLWGGAIYNISGTVELVDPVFDNNSANVGGAIYNNGGIVSVTSGQFSNNSAFAVGGHVFNTLEGEFNAVESQFISGSAIEGGAILNTLGATVNLYESSLVDNEATFGKGGAIYNEQGTVNLRNSTLALNSALNGTATGGAIYNASNLALSFVTIAQNEAGEVGGGLYADISSSVEVKNSIIADNVGGNCTINDAEFEADGENFDTDGTCGLTEVTSEDLDLQAPNYGGYTTQSMALGPSSVALEAAIDCTDINFNDVTRDQRGIERPQNDHCDVGAYELAPGGDTPQSSPFNVNTDEISNDGVCGVVHCTILEAFNAANANSDDSIINLQSGEQYDLNIGLVVTTDIEVNGNNAVIRRAEGEFSIITMEDAPILTLNDLTIRDGDDLDGGAIDKIDGTLTVNNVSFFNNQADSNGGAINNLYGFTIINDSLFENNEAVNGGAIYNYNGTITIDNTRFIDNKADNNGGAILSATFSGETLIITNSTISDNTATNGGGIYVDNDESADISYSTLSGNSASSNGGAIYNNGDTTLLNVTLSGNSATIGGAIDNVGSISISFTTITQNSASNAVNGDAVFKNSIVADNTVLFNCDGGSFSGSGANFADDSSCGFSFVNTSTPLIETPLDDNGGPTETHALTAGSPALDAATDCTNIVSSAVGFDQRGVTRPQGAQCDAGAFEQEVDSPQAGPTYTVNTTSDVNDGICGTAHCSLREAILASNANDDLSQIHFNIPGAGVKTINLGDTLPPITQQIIIDGTTQPGASCVGLPATLLIELNGEGAGVGTNGLELFTSDSQIRGLVINRFSRYGIYLNGADNNTIACNYIGTDAAGTSDLGNGEDGLVIAVGSDNNLIGGTGGFDGNLISGNGGTGITIGRVGSPGGTNNQIYGNRIGTNANGTAAIPNDFEGILINDGSSGAIIGGPVFGAGNLISGNGFHGIGIVNANDNVLQGNRIGTDVNGTAPLPNTLGGVAIDQTFLATTNNLIGGASSSLGNVIAFNNGVGVLLHSDLGAGNAVIGNSIHSNNGLGIDLGEDGVTANDALDSDSGPNNYQNYPTFTSVIVADGNTTFDGVLQSSPLTPFTIQIFSSPTCDTSGFGEGQTFVTLYSGITDADGFLELDFTLLGEGEFTAGQVVTAIAVDDENNSSEFSECVTVAEETAQTNPYTVNTTNMVDDGLCGTLHCSLIEAMNAAHTDEVDSTINLGEGQVYILTSVNNNFDDSPNGTPRVGSVITINGNNSTVARDIGDTPSFRIFYINGGSLTVNDLTVNNGDVGSFNVGGGFRLFNGDTLTLNNVTVVGNAAGLGGGIYSDGTLIINDSEISENLADEGGGIYSNGATTITNSLIDNNIGTDRGGGIYHNSALLLTLDNTTVSNNATTNSDLGDGGGIYNIGVMSIINGSVVSGNTAESGGGGIYMGVDEIATTLNLSDSVISDNIAESGGGGIYLANETTVVIDEATIADNTATNESSGGGIYVNNLAELEITNSTLSGNSAPAGLGGAIYNSLGEVVLVNVTIADNAAGSEEDAMFFQAGGGTTWMSFVTMADEGDAPSFYMTGGGATVLNSIIEECDYSDGLFDNAGGTFAIVSNCPSFVPLTVVTLSQLNLGPLANNGGPTQTIALGGASVAIDGAVSCGNLFEGTVTRDQRGITRPQGAECDAGAFESDELGDTPQTNPYTVNVTTMEDDGICGVEHCSLVEAINAANDDGIPSTVNLGSAETYTFTTPANNSDDFGGNSALPIVNTPITLNGNNSIIQRNLAFTCPDTENPEFRLIRVDAPGNFTVNNVTLRNGCETDDDAGGGAIYVGVGATMNLNNSTVTANESDDGGGGIRNDGTLTINSSIISNNVNLAGFGGGIDNVGGLLTINLSTISGNTADSNGGGVSNFAGGTVIVSQSTFSNNQAATGGALFNGSGGALTISASTINNNTASSGGIYNAGTLAVTNTTLSANSGAGLLNDGGSAEIINATFAFNNNSAVNSVSGTVTLYNSLLAKDSGNVGDNCVGTIVNGGTNLATDTSCAGFFNLALSALKLSPLANNGGPTFTHAIAPDSPAVDAATLATCPLTDQRGVLRPVGEGCDIGAFEFTTEAVPAVGTKGGAAALLNDGGQGEDFVRFGNAVFGAPAGTNWTGGTADLPSGALQSLGRDPSASDADHRTDIFSQNATRGGQNAVKVVINEIYPGALDAIELYNTGVETANMSGWQLAVYDATGALIINYTFPTGFQLEPNDYVVLYEGAGTDVLTGDNLVIYLGVSISWPDWNSAGAVELTNGDYAIDFVRWGDEGVNQFAIGDIDPSEGTQWIPPSPMSPLPNEALGRDSVSTDTDAGADWIIQQQSLGGRNPAQPPVENDIVDEAILIPSLPYRNSQNIVSAVFNPANEPTPSCSLDVSHTVWYRYIATANSTVRFQTDGSDFNTVLAVYTGTPGSFTEVACDNDSGESTRSRVDLAMTSGTTYYFMIGGTLNGGGNLVFGALPPMNDDFDDAITVGSIPFTDSQNTTAASAPFDDPAPSCGVAIGRTVWYEWTPTTNQAVRMRTTGSNFDTHISVWTGTRGALNQVACNDNAPNSALSSLLFQPVAGQTYYIMVGGTTDSGGQLIFELSLPVPPPNDNFSSVSSGNSFDVGDVSVTPYILTEDVTGATVEQTDPTPTCGNQVSGSVWFEYNATTNATVAFQTLGSDYDTVLSIWTGTPAATQIACNDDFSAGLETSYLELTGVPGTTYYILVQGYHGDSGTLTFSAYALAAAPANDQIADAILIDPLPFDDTQNTTGATVSVGDPNTSCDPNIGKTVWYRYEAGATSKILHLNTLGSNFDTVLSVYQDNGGVLTELICDDDSGPNGTSQLNLNTGQNVTLYVGIGGYGGVGGILQFHVEELSAAPPHDEFASPRIITSLPYDDSDNTVLAKTAANDPVTSCASLVGSSVFYQYTPSDNSPLVLHTNGSNFDTVLSIYTGATVETLVEVACDDNSGTGTASYIEFTPIAGETYTIVVVGNNGAKGQYNLHVEELSAPANDEFSGAIDVTFAPTTLTNTHGATDNPTDPATCNATAGRTVWYTYTTTTLGGPTTLRFDTIGSDYNTVLSVYTGSFGSLTLLACDDNSGGNFASRIDNIKASANTTYTIVVSGAFGETGQLKLNVSTLVGPINDDIENAIEIIGSPFVDTKDTSGATNAPDDPLACGVLANKTVWYTFTASADELLRLSLAGTDFDTVVGVFAGAPGALTPVTCDFFGDVDIPVTAGQTYYIMIGGYNFADDSGQLQLMTEIIPLPPNDDQDAPIIIPSLPYTNTQDTNNATSIGDPTISCDFTFGKSVWYQYTALPSDGLLRFNTLGSDFSTVLAVFKVVDDNLIQVGCNVFGGVDVLAEDSATYLIMVAGYQGAGGSMTLNVESVAPPSNDDLEDAKLIASLPYTDTVDTRGASDPSSDPLTCKPGALKSVWYRYEAVGNGTLSFDTSGSDFDTVIAVYSGEPNNLHLEFCVHGDTLDAEVTAGESYYIMIRDASAKGGQLVLNVAGDITPLGPSIDVTKVASVPAVTESGGDVTYTVRVKNTSLSQTVVINSVLDNPFGDLASYCNATLPATLAPNAFFECVYTTTVSGQAGAFVNTVTASGMAGDTPVTDTASATVTITDVVSSIQVTKTANRAFVNAPSQTTTFTVKIRNTSATDSVTISSVVDSVYGNVGGGCAPSLPATLASNAELTCTFTRTVSGTAGNSHVNVVTVNGLDDDNKAVTASGSLTLPISCATPDPNTHLKHAQSMLLGPTYNQGVIVNTSTDCYYEVGLAVYKRPNWVIDDQVLFDFETAILPPGGTTQLAVTLPECSAQVDLFYGHVLPDLNGKRYGVRLIQGRFVNGTNWCVITPEEGEAETFAVAMAQESAPVPLPPSSLAAVGGEGQISLTWADANSNTAETHLERMGANGAWSVVAILPIGETSYTDSGFACHTTAQYRLRAYNGVQFSAYSGTTSATTALCPAPSAPQNLLAAVTGEARVELAWTASEAGLVFDVELSADGANWTTLARVDSATYAYNNSALACGTGYQFRVIATRLSDGQVSAPSAPAFVAMPACAVQSFTATDALVGLYRDGFWQFRALGTDGAAEVSFSFGLAESGWQPFIGDFDGDGAPSLGLYKDGFWVVRNPDLTDTIIAFGPAEDGWQALVGDWDGDGRDGIGLYKAGQWLLKQYLEAGPADLSFAYGAGLNGAKALVGDWDGDGRDTPALYLGGQWYLSNTLAPAEPSAGFSFGPSQGGWAPVRGDWNGDGVVSVGLFKDGLWRLRNLNGAGATDIGFTFGLNQNGWTPVALYSGSLETLARYAQGGPLVLPSTTPPAAPSEMTPEATTEPPTAEEAPAEPPTAEEAPAPAPELTPEAPTEPPTAEEPPAETTPEAGGQ